MEVTVAAGLGVVLLMLLLIIRWKWRAAKFFKMQKDEYPTCVPVQLVHRLCPHNNVVQQFAIEEKDSLDEHLDILTRKLAEKVLHESWLMVGKTGVVSGFHMNVKDFVQQEGRLRVSKLKVRETQHEIDSLHAIDHDMRVRYRELMDALRNDLLSNEKECKRIQEQIEWVSRRRAEIRDEVRRGQKLYGQAAMELASNLTEMQRGRTETVIDKPQNHQSNPTDVRHRKEPQLPKATPISSLVIKPSPGLSEESIHVPPR